MKPLPQRRVIVHGIAAPDGNLCDGLECGHKRRSVLQPGSFTGAMVVVKSPTRGCPRCARLLKRAKRGPRAHYPADKMNQLVEVTPMRFIHVEGQIQYDADGRVVSHRIRTAVHVSATSDRATGGKLA